MAEVISYRDVTPRMRRIRFTGGNFAGKKDVFIPGKHLKILFPREGQDQPECPVIKDGRPVYKPGAVKPLVRTYTVRAYEAGEGALDIDFVLHGDEGPASAWAARVKPGNRIGIAVRSVKILPQADWYLFAGDHTALPAIASMLEQLESHAKGLALIEVPDEREEQVIQHPAGIVVSWLHRGSAPAGKSNLLIDAVRELTVPATGSRYVWLAAESTETKAMRELITRQTVLQAHELHAVGYWRLGVDEDVYHDMRHRGE